MSGRQVGDHLQIQPAGAKLAKPEKYWGDRAYVMDRKIDGWRFMLHVADDLDRPRLTGKRHSVVTGLLSEKGLCAPQLWPRLGRSLGYTVVDGEVTVPGGFRATASVMNASPEKAARAVARYGAPTFHVFDLLFFDGDDVRGQALSVRREMLRQALDREIIACENYRLVEQMPCDQASYDRVIAEGGEGGIIKLADGEYGREWFKVKRQKTLDVVVTGFTMAKPGKTGKYLGLIGAALVSVYTKNGLPLEVGRVSGMTDEIRVDMSLHRDKWIGSVIEIEAQEFAKERLRHPRFLRARPDTDPSECTWTKMMADLGQSGGVVGGPQLKLV
jgi:ATP-dependent DNA ligase